MNNKPTLTGANKMFFVFTAIFLAYQLILGMLLGSSLNEHIYIIIIANEVLIALSVLVYSIAKKLNLKETFRLNKLGIVPALLIIAASLPATYAAGMFNSLLIYLLQFIGDIPVQSIPTPDSLQQLMAGIVVIGVMPAVCEEIMHRGLMLKAYERRGSYKAIVFTAILFGLFHFDITNLLGPIFLGLIIGYYVVRTNSIFAGMLAHFMNNAIAVVLRFLTRRYVKETVDLSGAEFKASIILGLGSLFVVLVLMYAFTIVTRGKSAVNPRISGIRQDIRAVFTHWPIVLVILLYIFTVILFVLSIAAKKIYGA
ncbi:MAG: CPBP family intramembrane glutamic endopeptidase [Acetivibrionales bacterium]